MIDSHKIYLYDRIKETSYTIGTGNLTLNGAANGFSSFGSVYSNGDNVFYAATDGSFYEVGSGVYVTGVQNSIIRFPFRSSNSNNKVSFGEGIKEVFVTYPATNSVYTASGLQGHSTPQESGVAFWSSSNIINYDGNIVWDSGYSRLGILKSQPSYAIDIGGDGAESIIRSSGFYVGSSGILFPSGNNGVSAYSGGIQLSHYEPNIIDTFSGLNEIIELSGNANNKFILKEQNAGLVFAGPASGCTPPCSPDFPTFRPLILKDIAEAVFISGTIPKITNFSDNRILTSLGTATGINAESNFTYNSTTSNLVLTAENISGTFTIQRASSNSVSSDINLTKWRGTISSPQALSADDVIGSINFQTLNGSSVTNTAAQIYTYAEDDLGANATCPTTMVFKTSSGTGTLDNSVALLSDGFFNPRGGLLVNYSKNAVSYGDAKAMMCFHYPPNSIPNGGSVGGTLSWSHGQFASNAVYGYVVGSTSSAYITIPSGTVMASGYLIGSICNSIRNSVVGTVDNGTVNEVIGIKCSYGHSLDASGTTLSTTSAFGLILSPLKQRGTITNCYDIYMDSAILNSSSLDGNGNPVTVNGNGSISNRYGIYQNVADAGYKNYFAGKTGFNATRIDGNITSYTNSFHPNNAAQWTQGAYTASGFYGGGISLIDTASSNIASQSGYCFYTTASGVTLNVALASVSGSTSNVLSVDTLTNNTSAINQSTLDFYGQKFRIRNSKTPSSASDIGTSGDMCWDNSYIYVCVAPNTWKRTAISTWP
jgi:hypothetical protein